MELISVYATSSNLGKRTISTSLAYQAAKNGLQTLLIELDYVRPSIALSQGMTNPNKNTQKYLERAFQQNYFDVEDYIMRKNDIVPTQKALEKVHDQAIENLDYLIFPIDFDNSMIPKIPLSQKETLTEKVEYITNQFIQNIYALSYDVVIFSLPNNLQDMFAVPILLDSTRVVHVIGSNLTRMEEAKRTLNIFDKYNPEKWINVLNMAATQKLVDESDYRSTLLPIELHHIIPFDENRLRNELNAEIGSTLIKDKANSILETCGIEIQEPKKGKKFFQAKKVKANE